MLAKWIVAEASNRAAFDQAQTRWTKLLDHDGFMVQVGGWLESFPAKAGIFAVWRDWRAYRQFMESGHDELATQPRETDSRIETSVANVIMRISQPDPRLLVESAQCLRISDATLQPDSSPIFVARQLQIWNPALEAADGMLGALICRVDRNPNRFLAASFWRDRAALDNFQQTIFPATSKQADMETYMKALLTYHFNQERSWQVVKWV
jgi:heme-degrading monooxygenase HmoA